MRYAINIGTRTSERFGPVTELSLGRCVQALEAWGFEPVSFTRTSGEAEGTYAFVVHDNDYCPDKFEQVSTALEQDCVAVVTMFDVVIATPTRKAHAEWYLDWVTGGALIGPYANSWGEFDRALFIKHPL